MIATPTYPTGMVTHKMVVKRARELAVIKGRNAHDTSQSDMDLAERGLVAQPSRETRPRSSKKAARVSGRAKANAVVAIYKSHAEAEAAVKKLQHSGFDIKKLSIIGRDYHTDEQVVGYYNAGDRMKCWGKTGAFWGGVWGLLFGSAFFFVPGIGPLLVAGPLVGWIAGVLEGAVIVGGVSAIGAGLYSIGIPKDSILQYETALKIGKFMVIAHGTTREMAHAREIIQQSPAETLREHPVSKVRRPPILKPKNKAKDHE